MLDSLRIEGFKLFRELELPVLRRLNLILGNNNSGKSCLLEAIRLYASGGGTLVIRDLIDSRDSDWEARGSRLEEADVESPIRFLFHDFHSQNLARPLIRIGPIGGTKRLEMSTGLYQKIEADDGSVRLNPIADTDDAPGEDVEEMLLVGVGQKRRRPLGVKIFWNRGASILRQFPEEPTESVEVLGTCGLPKYEVEFLFDKVSLTPHEDQVLSCLRLIDSRIEGIALLGSSQMPGGSERTPVVRVAGSKERYPLRSMGDGLTRLFHIALCMVNAENGVVLIDEFENGLYWEVQDRLWPMIFEMAERFNVQVFATTHSSDCVRSFTSAWQAAPNAASVYRLERTQSSARATQLPMVNVSDALASEVEVR